MSETVGQVFERRGPCALMDAVLRLAETHRRIPVGHWHLALEPPWALVVNGTSSTIDHLRPWHAMILRDGLPLVVFDAVDGTQVGQSEAQCLAVLERAIEQAIGAQR